MPVLPAHLHVCDGTARHSSRLPVPILSDSRARGTPTLSLAASKQGINACVLAYGATGSGKTHTLHGTTASPGIVPLAIDALFEDSAHTDTVSYKLTVVELYNDRVADLLVPPKKNPLPCEVNAARKAAADIRLLADGSLMGSETFRLPVTSRSQMHALLRRAQAARSVASTAGNDRSSRSHQLIRIEVLATNPDDGRIVNGRLEFVDLAGVEPLLGTNATQETVSINRSLAALCSKIHSLSKQESGISHRDNKLTQLLSGSVGGNSKTLLIATVQSGAEHLRKSQQTIELAARMSNVIAQPVVNGAGTPIGATPRAALRLLDAQQKTQIEQLREELARVERARQESREARRQSRERDTRERALYQREAMAMAEQLRFELHEARIEVSDLQCERELECARAGPAGQGAVRVALDLRVKSDPSRAMPALNVGGSETESRGRRWEWISADLAALGDDLREGLSDGETASNWEGEVTEDGEQEASDSERVFLALVSEATRTIPAEQVGQQVCKLPQHEETHDWALQLGSRSEPQASLVSGPRWQWTAMEPEAESGVDEVDESERESITAEMEANKKMVRMLQEQLTLLQAQLASHEPTGQVSCPTASDLAGHCCDNVSSPQAESAETQPRQRKIQVVVDHQPPRQERCTKKSRESIALGRSRRSSTCSKALNLNDFPPRKCQVLTPRSNGSIEWCDVVGHVEGKLQVMLPEGGKELLSIIDLQSWMKRAPMGTVMSLSDVVSFGPVARQTPLAGKLRRRTRQPLGALAEANAQAS